MSSKIVALKVWGLVGLTAIAGAVALEQLYFHQEKIFKPEAFEAEEEENENPLKNRKWTPEEAAQKQSELERLRQFLAQTPPPMEAGTFANGQLAGEWRAVGPKDMPGCWDQAYVDSTSSKVWGVTCAHYGGSQFVWQGTLAGDDFTLQNAHYPTRIIKVFGLSNGAGFRTVIATEPGKIAYSDDGVNWSEGTGVSGVVSLTLNRKNGNILYAATKTSVYKSTDKGATFTLVQNFGTSAETFIYSPLYGNQPGADKVYLSRNGSFYVLTSSASAFTSKGTWTWPGTNKEFSMGGDSRKIYITSNGKFYVSSDEGVTWTQKTPRGDYYGDLSGSWSSGRFIAVNPSNPNNLTGGYTGVLASNDGFGTVLGNSYGWGQYQNQTSDAVIRTKYHPDFQSSQFFYDQSGKVLAIYSTDGGLIRSYTAFTTGATDASTYTSTTFVNLTMVGVQTSEVYNGSMGSGAQNAEHVYIGTQDQGGQTFTPNGTGENLNSIQSPGGDGPECYSGDNLNAWCISYTADKVYPPKSMYSGSTFKGFNNANGTVLTLSTGGGWYFHEAFVDRASPTTNFWPLSKTLNKVTWNGSSLSATSTTKTGGNYFAGMAQAFGNPNLMIVFKGGKVYKSTNRGSSWDAGVATGMADNGSSAWDRCGGWILNGNDNWMLAACPSNNGVVSVLSKNGGATWTNVSGIFPNGDVSGLYGTSDGKFVFAGTAYGPYVFVVAEEKWYNIAGAKTPWFNTTAMNYVASTNSVRFGTWGSGVWEFRIKTTGTSSTSTSSAAGSSVAQSSSATSSIAASSSATTSSSQVTSSSSGNTGICLGIAQYNSSTIYDVAGIKVVYNNSLYSSKWWTQNNTPDQAATNGPWSYLGDCGAVQLMPNHIAFRWNTFTPQKTGFKVWLPSTSQGSIQLIDLQGKIYFDRVVHGDGKVQSFDWNKTLQPGVYVVRFLMNGAPIKTIKFGLE